MMLSVVQQVSQDLDDTIREKQVASLKKKKRLSRKTYDYCAEEAAQNFLFVFGHRPGKGIQAETLMVFEIVQMLTQEYDTETLSIQIPSAFDFLKGDDVNFEIV